MNDTGIQTLDYIEKSGEALYAAEQLATAVAAEREKVAAIVPIRADLLVQAGLIETREKASAAQQLGSHEGALNIVGNLVQIVGEQRQKYEQKLAAAGQGKPEKSASNESNGRTKSADAGADYESGGYIGRRRGAGEKSAADRIFEERLGIADRMQQ